MFFYVQPENGDAFAKKGDFIIGNEHVIEITTKACLVVKNKTNRMPEVHVGPQ